MGFDVLVYCPALLQFTVNGSSFFASSHSHALRHHLVSPSYPIGSTYTQPHVYSNSKWYESMLARSSADVVNVVSAFEDMRHSRLARPGGIVLNGKVV
jgi:hypothetical protein